MIIRIFFFYGEHDKLDMSLNIYKQVHWMHTMLGKYFKPMEKNIYWLQ